MNKCEVCSGPANSQCSACYSVSYCSKDHQKLHWKHHKENCFPFEIKEDKRLGRYLVAKRDIVNGSIVLREKPLVSGPSQTTGPVCLGCWAVIGSESVPCSRCGWPMCSDNCSNNPIHEPECKWAVDKRKEKVKISQFITPHPTYSCITPLRALYLKEKSPQKWKDFSSLESHCTERIKDGKYEADRFSVASLLRRFYKLEDISEEEILRVCGIIQINGHEVPLSEPGYVAVYGRCSLLEHNCIPNCSKTFLNSGEVLVRAAVNIKKGENLSISYTDPIWGTPARLEHLSITKYFDCACARCSDVTEFGSYISAVLCREKNCKGLVLPNTFSTPGVPWSCSECFKSIKSSKIHKTLRKFATEVHSLPKDDIKSHVDMISSMSHSLHKNHSLVLQVRLALAQMIGQTTQGLEAVDDNLLNVKETLCRELIELSHRVFQAENRILGVLYFELHAAVAEKTRREMNSAKSNTTVLQTQLMESGGYLERVLFYLKYEPDVLPEGKIRSQAEKNMKDLKHLYKSMGIAF